MELLSRVSPGLQHPTSASWEEALKKERAKVKELEDKYNTRILENGVTILMNFLFEGKAFNWT